MSQTNLERLQARRRGHLKAALMKYAKVFNMAMWFGKEGEVPGYVGITPAWSATPEHHRAAEYVIRGSMYGGDAGAVPVKVKLDKFEECGTVCCIAGLDYARSGRNIPEQREFYGIKDDRLYNTAYWPQELEDEYQDARDRGDRVGMVVAAQKAIDYYANLRK